jgi:hypothetical protein
MSFPGIANTPNCDQVLAENNVLETVKTKVNYYTTYSTEKYLNINQEKQMVDDLNQIFGKLLKIRKDVKKLKKMSIMIISETMKSYKKMSTMTQRKMLAKT